MFLIYSLFLLFWSAVLIDFLLGFKTILSIDTVEPDSVHSEFITVILAAKNEEKSIKHCLDSLLAQKNVRLEIITVNDRSKDNTGPIMEEAARKYPSIHTIHIDKLPEGWLGKNHALAKGVEQAKGNYFLFTDADILFTPTACCKALTYLQKEQADHLTVSPDLRANSLLLRGFISYFLFGFSVLKRPWTANRPKPAGGMGIGAFQLISRSCYQSIGGHEKLKLRPDDDLALGERVKRFGYKQRLATGLHSLSVEWYPSLSLAFKGFEKNAFAGLNYSVWRGLFAVICLIMTQLLPYVFLFSSLHSVQIISALNLLLLFCLYAITIKSLTRCSVFIIAGQPIYALLFVYMLMRALILTWIRGGIEWRGNRYPLQELKQYYKNSKED